MVLKDLPNKPPRLLVFSGNPTPYHAPLFRGLSAALDGRMLVMFGGSVGMRPFFNKEINGVIEWDVPTVAGYYFKVYRTFAPERARNFFRWNNPGMLMTVFFSPSTHVLIHGYDTVSAWYVYFAALLSGKKIIWRGETVPKPNSEKTIASRIKRLVLPLYFRGVHKVLWSCLNNRDYLATFLKSDQGKLVRFPCAVDNGFFRNFRLDATGRAAARYHLGIPDNHLVMVTCSRLTKRKRAHLIIQAMAQMSTDKVTLLILGDGPERNSLEELALQLKVSINVIGFVGQKEVARYLSLADVFLLLSSYDASPKALNEALNFPLAMIVSTGVGTARDLVHHDINGYRYETGQDQELVNWLDALASSPKKCRSLGEGNKEILKDFTIEEDVSNLIDIINHD